MEQFTTEGLEDLARDVARLELVSEDLDACSQLSIKHTEAAIAAADIVRTARQHLKAMVRFRRAGARLNTFLTKTDAPRS